jgi:formate dehydrogenase major subunit
MATVNITIDGKKIAAKAGQTIFEAATEAGVDIPHLCHHPSLPPEGACRMCLVEVEKQRVLQPACTFPVTEGMVVHTESPKVIEARRFVLQLLFSERNHFCMYCQMSGDCELQTLAYRYNLDHWVYDRPYPRLPVDSSREYFVMDHNRCVLCRRCVRACSELVGNHTLGLKNRGASTMITADNDIPFGDSTCVSCGTCLSVCPTGALMDRKSAYLGREIEVGHVKSTCTRCSVGCGLDLITNDNHVLRVEADWDAEPNRGLLCVMGRFEPLWDSRKRATAPMVKRNGRWGQAEWDEALDLVADELGNHKGAVTGLASGQATNESLALFAKVCKEGLKCEHLGLLTGTLPEASGDFDLTELDLADFFVVTGEDLTVNHQVAGFYIKRRVTEHGARLGLLGDEENGMAPYALFEWGPDEVDKAIEVAKNAEKPVVIYGAGVKKSTLKRLRSALEGKATFMGLSPTANSGGAAAAGIAGGLGADTKGLYILACEEKELPRGLKTKAKKADFVAVQASYLEPWADIADVILPSPVAFEQAGTFTNDEGRTLTLTAAVKTNIKSDGEALEALAQRLGL